MSVPHKEKLIQINTGRVVSEETKEKLRQYTGDKSSFYGKHHSVETKKQISDARKGSKGKSGEDNAFYGKRHSEETKDKMRIAAKNKPPMTEETRQRLRCKKKPRPILQCPHCAKSGDASGMKRWHFDNCKTLTS
jgi:ABC-type multidrug transport system ATPase subunit